MLVVVKNWVFELLLPGSILELKHILPLFAGPPKRRRRHPQYLKRGKPNLVVIPKGKIILGPMTKLWADSLFLQISWGECKSANVNRLASSVTRVVICVSRAFSRRTKNKERLLVVYHMTSCFIFLTLFNSHLASFSSFLLLFTFCFHMCTSNTFAAPFLYCYFSVTYCSLSFII